MVYSLCLCVSVHHRHGAIDGVESGRFGLDFVVRSMSAILWSIPQPSWQVPHFMLSCTYQWFCYKPWRTYETGKRAPNLAASYHCPDEQSDCWSNCVCRKPTRFSAWVFLLGLLLFLFYQPFAIQRGENGDAWVAPESRLNFQERGWRKPPALFCCLKQGHRVHKVCTENHRE